MRARAGGFHIVYLAQMQTSAEFLRALEAAAASLGAQLHKLEAAKPVDELTVDDVYAIHPEYRERIQAALRADDWAVAEGGARTPPSSAPTVPEFVPGKTAVSGVTLDYLH